MNILDILETDINHSLSPQESFTDHERVYVYNLRRKNNTVEVPLGCNHGDIHGLNGINFTIRSDTYYSYTVLPKTPLSGLNNFFNTKKGFYKFIKFTIEGDISTSRENITNTGIYGLFMDNHGIPLMEITEVCQEDDSGHLSTVKYIMRIKKSWVMQDTKFTNYIKGSVLKLLVSSDLNGYPLDILIIDEWDSPIYSVNVPYTSLEAHNTEISRILSEHTNAIVRAVLSV